ncbi:hypothetical protein C6382_12895 [Pseudomonas sp. BBP2017]|nr:hypothetical protein C6382_12895 [Pseudomonas sp. BBP2017]
MPRPGKAKAAQGQAATRAAIVKAEDIRRGSDNRQAARAVNYFSRGNAYRRVAIIARAKCVQTDLRAAGGDAGCRQA